MLIKLGRNHTSIEYRRMNLNRDIHSCTRDAIVNDICITKKITSSNVSPK